MRSPLLIWLIFIFVVLAIGVGGYFLSVYGDEIGETTKLGQAWVGLLLLAMVTSLPELVTGLSSLWWVGSSDLAAGGIFGSCTFNLLIFAFLDAASPRDKNIFSLLTKGHILSAFGSILTLAIIALFMSFALEKELFFGFGLSSLLLGVVYLLFMWFSFRFESENQAENLLSDKQADRNLYLRFTIAAIVVIVAGVVLSEIADQIAIQLGIHRGFVGSLFVALVTSLPELVVTSVAFYRGAHVMAFANLFGSNLFNMMVFATEDLAFLKGPLLQNIQKGHTITIVAALLMSFVVVGKTPFRFLGLWLNSWLLIGIYILSTYLTYVNM